MSESELFLVRVWRHFSGAFRAAVRRIDDEEPRLFTTPGEVAHFLAGGACNGAASAGAAAELDSIGQKPTEDDK
jgi:hypothetical protein